MMIDVSHSDTPLKATFRIKLNGETVAIKTIGDAYRFITSLSTVEWMEFQSQHNDAKVALEAAAEDAMMSVQGRKGVGVVCGRAKVVGKDKGRAGSLYHQVVPAYARAWQMLSLCVLVFRPIQLNQVDQ